MSDIKIDIKNALPEGLSSEINVDGAKALEILQSKSGAGNDFLGWLELPNEYSEADIADIEAAAASFKDCEYVVCIGIGGSYLGAKAVVEALSDSFAAFKVSAAPRILFAGQNIRNFSQARNSALSSFPNRERQLSRLSLSAC